MASTKKWLQLINSQSFLPLTSGEEVDQNENSAAFAIKVTSVDVFNKIKGKAAQLQVRTSLFSSTSKNFFGRTWVGPIVNYKDGTKTPYNKSVYLHTTSSDPGILIVFEVILTCVDVAGVESEVSVGWTAQKLVKPGTKIVDLCDGTPASAAQVELYQGSPRALLYLDGDVEGNAKLLKLPGGTLLCAIQTHRKLLKVAHLIPENCFVGHQDVVPGIISTKQKDNAVVDIFVNPKLERSVSCSVDHIYICLSSALDMFETSLCNSVLEDYCRHNGKQVQGQAQVSKRCLRIGVHNGWTYVAPPEEVQLIPNSINASNLNRTGSLKRSQQRATSTASTGNATNLVHKGNVDIEGLLDNPIFHIVFTLIYEIMLPSVGISDVGSKKIITALPIQSCNVRWAAFSPIANDAREFSLDLCGGLMANPEEALFYAATSTVGEDGKKLNKSQLSEKISFSLKYKDEPSMKSFVTDQRASAPVLSKASSSSSLRDHSEQNGQGQRKTGGLTGKPPPANNMYDYENQLFAVDPNQQTSNQPYPSIKSTVPVISPFIQPQNLQELSIMPQYVPILAAPPSTRRASGLSRASYASLHSAGFPPILDHKGSPAEIVDSSDVVNVDLSLEERGRLRVNEIILQFMAFTQVAGRTHQPRTVFFTFQFYRYPSLTSERLVLSILQKDMNPNAGSMPFILQRFNKDGSLMTGPPGYQVKYQVDPTYLKPGEVQLFYKYLAEQKLHIDVWDGDSLLLIGSCVVDLIHLCRQGRDAVQTTHELDVFSNDYFERSDNGSLAVGDATRDGAAQSVEVKVTISGRLHLRLGNVGRMMDSKGMLLKSIVAFQSKKFIISPDTVSTAMDALGKTKVQRANHVADVDPEVSMVIDQRRKTIGAEDLSSEIRRLPADKMKKLARIEKIRQTEGVPDSPPAQSVHRDKEERSRILQTIVTSRQLSKRNNIVNMLNLAITTEHTVFASMGTTEFFEFVLRNPYNIEHSVTIDWQDQELDVISDARQWRYFKMLNNVTTPVEEHLFNMVAGEKPQVFLRPKESVIIPFRFLSLRADPSTDIEAPFDPHGPYSLIPALRTRNKQQDSRQIQVTFRTQDMRPISILALNVELQPHLINQTYRLYHPEHSFLKKLFRLPPLHTLMQVPGRDQQPYQLLVRCSDSNVLCDSKPVQPGEPHNISIKVACGEAPQVKRFYVVIYADIAMARPLQIWQFFVYAMQRVDIATVLGQTSRVALVLRGTQSSRLVQCFSSHADEMQVDPRDPFMLPANSLQELHVGVRPLLACGGTRTMYINVVDVELHQVVRSWLLNVIAKPPIISKSFDLALPVGGGDGCNKKIAFTNPYPAQRVFSVLSSRPDLVQFRENRLNLGPGATTSISLRFAPASVPGLAEILIFINDDVDRSEETLRINATYK